MDVRVHGKNMHVDEEVVDVATQKISNAARIFDTATTTDVEFTENNNPRASADKFKVEITGRAAGHTVRVEAAAAEDRAALDIAVEKFERQLRRLKERLIQRSRKPSNKGLNPGVVATDEPGEASRVIVRTKKFVTRPMTPEEAALEMEMLGHDFFLFLNAESGDHCVLYHRRDGSLGLIEPV